MVQYSSAQYSICTSEIKLMALLHDHLLPVPFLSAVIHMFRATGLGGCCLDKSLS